MTTAIAEIENLEQALTTIPTEYQELFRAAIENELADAGIDGDQETLTYMRQRLADFEAGTFIRPDGKTGSVTLDPDSTYEVALEQMSVELGEETEEDIKERRNTIIKVIVFVVVAIVLVFVMKPRNDADAEIDGTLAEATAVVVEAGLDSLIATPTPEPIPEISDSEQALETVGSLGGSLTIGRPSSIEIYYSSSKETIALPIDPSQPTPKGELRYEETVMQSDTPVAVWLFGTVLNYSIGVPEGVVSNLEADDRIVINTDTGKSLRFVVTGTQTRANYETNTLFSQSRIGLTLFALPALAEDSVTVAFANYDISSEQVNVAPAQGLGDRIALPNVEFSIDEALYSHEPDGRLQVVIEGVTHSGSEPLLMSLATGGIQTESRALNLVPNANWQEAFILPSSVAGANLLAEFRSVSGIGVASVYLGEIPQFEDSLEVTILDSFWDTEASQGVINLSIHNPNQGAVRVSSEYIDVSQEGGRDVIWSVLPNLPTLIELGQTVNVSISFSSEAANAVFIQIGSDLWRIPSLPFPDSEN